LSYGSVESAGGSAPLVPAKVQRLSFESTGKNIAEIA
jgi:hypothetical protein